MQAARGRVHLRSRNHCGGGCSKAQAAAVLSIPEAKARAQRQARRACFKLLHHASCYGGQHGGQRRTARAREPILKLYLQFLLPL